MAFRDRMIALADKVRRKVAVEALETRLHTAVVRTRTWGGPRIGEGAFTDVDLVLDPVPHVITPQTTRQWMNEGGLYERGDILITQISATYTETELGDNAAGDPWPAATEVFWVVDGEPFDVAGTEKRLVEWRVHLRQRRPN